mmetsp:Transcript_91114/g.262756  ORF Transcript_91114/g.262756 Transcript_91114/m.262756 type:complete len:96 (+) Transcript_91114:89-376(+)
MRQRSTYKHLHETPPPLRGPKVPWKEVFLSVTLLFVGSSFLICGGCMAWKDGIMEAAPLLTLGTLCFIPGSYHTFLFIQIFRKVPGYTFDLILTS